MKLGYVETSQRVCLHVGFFGDCVTFHSKISICLFITFSKLAFLMFSVTEKSFSRFKVPTGNFRHCEIDKAVLIMSPTGFVFHKVYLNTLHVKFLCVFGLLLQFFIQLQFTGYRLGTRLIRIMSS